MSQPLPYDEIEMWHGHPDLLIIVLNTIIFTKQTKKLKKILNTPDDGDVGYFLEVDLRHPDEKKKKQRNFHLVLKIKLFVKINVIIIWKYNF